MEEKKKEKIERTFKKIDKEGKRRDRETALRKEINCSKPFSNKSDIRFILGCGKLFFGKINFWEGLQIRETGVGCILQCHSSHYRTLKVSLTLITFQKHFYFPRIKNVDSKIISIY